MIGASDARAEGRLRGLTASLAYVDEITLLPEAFFVQLLARHSMPGARSFGSTNPDGPRHWLRTSYLDREDDLDRAQWHFRLADNPSPSPSDVASLAAEYTGPWRRRMIDGAWVVAEGATYEMWDEARHVVDELPAMHRYWAAVDYGTTNPFPLPVSGSAAGLGTAAAGAGAAVAKVVVIGRGGRVEEVVDRVAADLSPVAFFLFREAKGPEAP